LRCMPTSDLLDVIEKELRKPEDAIAQSVDVA
jgi:hypothetical protein